MEASPFSVYSFFNTSDMQLVSHPVLCNYYVTYRCNASCYFCDIWEKPSPYVNPDDVYHNLKDLKRLGVKIIDFTGGEPLLHRNIAELLSMAKEMKFLTTLTTNCLLYPKKAKEIAGLVDMLHFSLDYYSKEKHDKARGVSCYDHVIESIGIARSLGERPDIIFTVLEDNIGEIGKLYSNISFSNGLVLILNPAFDYNQISLGQKMNEAAMKELRRWGKRKMVYLNEAFLKLREDGGNHISSPVCKAASTTIVISPFNELVLPCYHLGISSIPVDNELYSLYRSEKVRQHISMEGRYLQCEGCTVNCYMQPSFAVNLNKYFYLALPSTLKYNYIKGTWKKMLV